MYKTKTRLIAFIMTFVLTLLVVPAGSFVFALDNDFEAKVSLDYDALFGKAYVINPNWSNLSGTLSFEFCGNSYTEQYEKSRHFNTFDAAMTQFKADATDVTNEVPVFIFAPATYNTAVNVPYNAIILGNNAGMDPNVKTVTAQNVASVDDMKNGWSAASRKSATIFTAGINSARTSDESAGLSGRVTVVVDGVDFSTESYVTNVTETADAKHQIDINVQNSVIRATQPIYVFKNADAKTDVIRNGLFNVRMDGTLLDDLYDELTSVIKMDGVYFANSSTPFVTSKNPVKTDLEFELVNSFLYNITTENSAIALKTHGEYPHKAYHTFANNLFYHVGQKATSYGMVRFETQHSNGVNHFSDNRFEYNFYGNTIVAYPQSLNITLFNGNQTTYQTTSYTLNFNHNRVIGYRSILPNHSSDKYTELSISADFNYNYYEYIDPHFGEFKGTKTLYSNSYKSKDGYITDKYLEKGQPYFDNIGEGGYIDPFDYPNLAYYTDWSMTTAKTDNDYSNYVNWEIESFSFYDEVNNVFVNNDAFGLVEDSVLFDVAIIVSVEPGQKITLSDDSIIFRNKNVKTRLIGVADNEITAPESGETECFLEATDGTSTRYYQLLFKTDYGRSYDAFPDTEAYLYAPDTAGLANGSAYTARWDGMVYAFTVGTNVFATMDEIFAVSGSDAPTILIAPGEYDTITITKPCTIKGYNYACPASTGSGVAPRNYGWGWGSNENTVVSGIIIGTLPEAALVNIQGITLTGTVMDKLRTNSADIQISNSVIASLDKTDNDFVQFDISNDCASLKDNAYTLKGVRIDSISKNENGEGLLFNNVPSKLTLDNVHSTATGLTSLFASEIADVDITRDLTITNSRFENVTGSSALFGNIAVGKGNSYVMTNTVVMAADFTGALIKFTPGFYKKAIFKDNIFINESGSAALMEIDYNNKHTCSATVKGNRVIGFDKGYTAINASSVWFGRYIDVSGNYFSEYHEEFTKSETGVYPAGKIRCRNHYADYSMKTKKLDNILVLCVLAVIVIGIAVAVLLLVRNGKLKLIMSKLKQTGTK